jgi:hypothetical protein
MYLHKSIYVNININTHRSKVNLRLTNKSLNMNVRNRNGKNARNGQKGTAWYFNLKKMPTRSKEVENIAVMCDLSSLFKTCFIVVCLFRFVS